MKPTLKEIVNEMGSDAKNIGIRVENSLRSVPKLSVLFGGGFLFGNGWLYEIASNGRLMRKIDDSKFLHDKTRKEIFYGGFILGLVGNIGHLYFYSANPDYLPILAATNAASGIYEWGRNAKKRIEGEQK